MQNYINKKELRYALGVLAGLLVIWGILSLTGSKPIEAEFVNNAGDSMYVSFNNEDRTATIEGGDYDGIKLVQATSASGARYVNEENGLELWNKGEDLTLKKGEELVFEGKVFRLPEEGGEMSSDEDLYVFAGPTWVWQETRSAEGSVTRPQKTGEYTITFEVSGKVLGETDCNNFSGSYTASAGNVLTFGPFMSTLMYCEGSQETEFSQAVSNSSQYTFTKEGDLVLMMKEGGTVHFKKR